MPIEPAKRNSADIAEEAAQRKAPEDAPLAPDAPMSARERLALVACLLAFAALYAFLARASYQTHAVWSPDTGARLAMVRNYQAYGNLIYLRYGNADVDPNQLFSPYGLLYGDHLIDGYLIHLPRGYCTVFLPLFPFLSSFGYRLFGFAGLFLLPVLGGVGTLYLTYLLARGLGLRSRLLVLIATGAATPLLIYSAVFWDHSLQMMLAALIGYWLLRALQSGRMRFAVGAGVTLGIGVFFQELFGLLLVTLLIASVTQIRLPSMRRAVAGLAAGFAPMVGLWGLVNWMLYGVAEGPHLLIAENIAHSPHTDLTTANATLSRALLELTGYEQGWGWHFLAVAGLLALTYVVLLCIGGKLLRFTPFLCILFVPITLAWLARSHWAYGLFQATPLLIPALAFPCLARRGGIGENDPPISRAFYLWIGLAYALFSLVVLTHSQGPGLNWGNRYLLTGLPFLMVLSARVLEGNYRVISSPWRLAAGLSVALLLAASLFSQIKGFGMVLRDERFFARVVADFEASASPVLVCGSWDLPSHDPAIVTSKRRVFMIRNPAENGEQLFAIMDRLHIDSFAFYGDDNVLVGLMRVGRRRKSPFVAIGREEGTERGVHFERQARGVTRNPILPVARPDAERPFALAQEGKRTPLLSNGFAGALALAQEGKRGRIGEYR